MCARTHVKVIQLSPIFDTYPDDFNNVGVVVCARCLWLALTAAGRQDYLSYITNFTTPTQANFILHNKLLLTVSFFDFNDHVNGVGLQCAASRPCYTALDLLITCLVVGVVGVFVGVMCFVQRRKRRSSLRDYLSL